MGKIKKFANLSIRKITGGKDPIRLVEDFITRLGFDPDECQKHKNSDDVRWMVSVEKGEDLEILVEGLKSSADTTIYMGVNIATVPVRGGDEMLAAALEIADGLVGIKISLVGHYLVLSASMGTAGISVDEIDYSYRLITAQSTWFKETLAEELGWEQVPSE